MLGRLENRHTESTVLQLTCDSFDVSGSCSGSSQHQAEARGGVHQERGGEGDDDRDDHNDDDDDDNDAGDIPLLRLWYPHPLYQLAARGWVASSQEATQGLPGHSDYHRPPEARPRPLRVCGESC